MEQKILMFKNRLSKMWKHRRKQAQRQGIVNFRIYDHDIPEFPISVDIYEDKLYLAEYQRNHGFEEAEHQAWMEKTVETLAEIVGIEKSNIFLKLRKRKDHRLDQYKKLTTTKNEFIVQENGYNFLVNLSDYLDTGLFLDHRNTRKIVADLCKEKRVLNLFAYTGSFSVYAAMAGATEVITVDLSNTYLDWAKENFKLNGLTISAKYSFIRADVLTYLPIMPTAYFDIIILDPPTFSNSKKMKHFLSIQEDHIFLIDQCLRTLKTGGHLFFSTNYAHFKMDYAALKDIDVKDITKKTTPFDFEGKLKRYCFLITKP